MVTNADIAQCPCPCCFFFLSFFSLSCSRLPSFHVQEEVILPRVRDRDSNKRKHKKRSTSPCEGKKKYPRKKTEERVNERGGDESKHVDMTATCFLPPLFISFFTTRFFLFLSSLFFFFECMYGLGPICLNLSLSPCICMFLILVISMLFLFQNLPVPFSNLGSHTLRMSRCRQSSNPCPRFRFGSQKSSDREWQLASFFFP